MIGHDLVIEIDTGLYLETDMETDIGLETEIGEGTGTKIQL